MAPLVCLSCKCCVRYLVSQFACCSQVFWLLFSIEVCCRLSAGLRSGARFRCYPNVVDLPNFFVSLVNVAHLD